MRIRQNLHCLLIAPDPAFTDQWSAWCPELDVATCGDHPDNAVAMLEDAVRVVVESAVSYDYFDSAGDRCYKRVMHPSRLGLRSNEDDSWKTFQELKEENRKARSSWFSLDELADGLDDRILVQGHLEVETRSGVPKVSVWFQDQGFVPSETFRVDYEQKYPRSREFSVRSSVLRRAGEDGQNVVTAEAASVLGRDLVTSAQVRRVNV